jgi:hypothetical protein
MLPNLDLISLLSFSGCSRGCVCGLGECLGGGRFPSSVPFLLAVLKPSGLNGVLSSRFFTLLLFHSRDKPPGILRSMCLPHP